MQPDYLKSQKKKKNQIWIWFRPISRSELKWSDLKWFFSFHNAILIWVSFNCIVNVALVSIYSMRSWLDKRLKMVWLLEEHKFKSSSVEKPFFGLFGLYEASCVTFNPYKNWGILSNQEWLGHKIPTNHLWGAALPINP